VVSDNQAYKQFGNSVSVPVVTGIAKEIKRQIFDLVGNRLKVKAAAQKQRIRILELEKNAA